MPLPQTNLILKNKQLLWTLNAGRELKFGFFWNRKHHYLVKLDSKRFVEAYNQHTVIHNTVPKKKVTFELIIKIYCSQSNHHSKTNKRLVYETV